MAKFRNRSPLGDLEIPALGIVVGKGEAFDVPPELVAGIANQSQFEPVDKAAKDARAAAVAALEADEAEAQAPVPDEAAEPDEGTQDAAGDKGDEGGDDK